MIYLGFLQTFALVTWIKITSCGSINNPLLNEDSVEDVVKHLSSKGYLPNENDLSKISTKSNSESETTYILSKLTDDELIRMLKDYPKQDEYTPNDVINLAESKKSPNEKKLIEIEESFESNKREPQTPVFKLNHKEVDPFAYNAGGDPKYNAYQTINNILYSHPRATNSEENEANKEMIFDVLVAQLKSLCCKKSKPKKTTNKLKVLMESFFNKLDEKKQAMKNRASENKLGVSKEYIFLVVNDEIKSNNMSDDLIQVDPDSLSKNSSVLLLGPITTPLDESELSLVMKRISGELSQPEYLPLLDKLSKGSLGGNFGLKNSLITGPQTRRYIKPHRCNHQSLLTRIYNGPKWLICTGYLNLNTPSLYD